MGEGASGSTAGLTSLQPAAVTKDPCQAFRKVACLPIFLFCFLPHFSSATPPPPLRLNCIPVDLSQLLGSFYVPFFWRDLSSTELTPASICIHNSYAQALLQNCLQHNF